MRIATIATLLVATSASASEPVGGFYLGADAAVIDASAGRRFGILVGTRDVIVRVRPDSAPVSRTDASWGAHLGYRIHRFLAIELGYTDFRSMSVDETYDLSSIFPFPIPPEFASPVDFRASGISLSWLAWIPVSERFEAFVRVGVLHSEQAVNRRFRAVLPGQSTVEHSTDDVPIFGAGVAYSISQNWQARVEAQSVGEMYGSGEFDSISSVGPIRIQRYGLAVAYRF